MGSFSDKSSFSENIFPKEFHSWLWTQITHQKKLVILSAWQALRYYPVNAAALCISSCVAVARRPQQLLRSSSNSCWASSLICHKPKGSSGERMLSPATAWLHYSDAPALSLSWGRCLFEFFPSPLCLYYFSFFWECCAQIIHSRMLLTDLSGNAVWCALQGYLASFLANQLSLHFKKYLEVEQSQEAWNRGVFWSAWVWCAYREEQSFRCKLWDGQKLCFM